MSLPFLAALPVLVLLSALFLVRLPLYLAAPLGYASAVGVLTVTWEMPAALLLAGTIKGALVSADILLIIFGAVFFLEFLKQTPVLRAIELHLAHLSPDRRIQAVIVAFLFGSFIEGSAGFGTPAAIVAPLLVALGFPVMTAITVALVANSTAVAFGAVGTPVRVGFAGLDVAGVAVEAAAINLVAGISVPLMIVGLVVLSSPRRRWRDFSECVPWALWAGLSFLVPHWLLARVGYEFPSLLGGPVGLVLTAVSLRWGFLVPKRQFHFDAASQARLPRAVVPAAKAALPYGILAGLLLAGKLLLGDLRYALSLHPEVEHVVGVFNPGLAFLLSAALVLSLPEARGASLRSAAGRASRALFKPVIAVFFITAMVQGLILSARNEAGLPGALQLIASSFDPVLVPWISPVIGAFGSFMAGSATVSNLLFGTIQVDMAAAAGAGLTTVLALQLVGAGIGNMIALPNVLAVEATVKESGREAEIIGRAGAPCLVYLMLAAVVGWVLG